MANPPGKRGGGDRGGIRQDGQGREAMRRLDVLLSRTPRIGAAVDPPESSGNRPALLFGKIASSKPSSVTISVRRRDNVSLTLLNVLQSSIGKSVRWPARFESFTREGVFDSSFCSVD